MYSQFEGQLRKPPLFWRLPWIHIITFRQVNTCFPYLIFSIFQIRFEGVTFFWFLFVKKNQILTSVFKSSSSSTRSCQSNINAWCIFLSHTLSFSFFFKLCRRYEWKLSFDTRFWENSYKNSKLSCTLFLYLYFRFSSKRISKAFFFTQ